MEHTIEVKGTSAPLAPSCKRCDALNDKLGIVKIADVQSSEGQIVGEVCMYLSNGKEWPLGGAIDYRADLNVVMNDGKSYVFPLYELWNQDCFVSAERNGGSDGEFYKWLRTFKLTIVGRTTITRFDY